MRQEISIAGYKYQDAAENPSHAYLLPEVERLLQAEVARGSPRRIFDLGCGNGSVAAHLATAGFEVTGVDPSDDGIAQARIAYPRLALHQGSCYDDLAGAFGTFPLLLSLEVVEHVYAPRAYAKAVHDLLQPGGLAILSTPYHSYLKNLALAVSGKMDRHFTALWDDGHIKFWSQGTLGQLLLEAGFRSVGFSRVGRIPSLAKSMIAIARR